MSGVSRMQRWTNIEIPIAFPTIMLGVNQTVVFSLQMVILGALIGTEDLGQIIFGALSRTKDGAGVALTLGVFVSLIAISVDVIVRKWAEDRKKALGFEVIGTISLKFSNGYTQILPTISSAISYVACFYFLSRCLNEFSSIGFVYALWAGLGIVLITLLGIFFFKNVIDIPGIIGISLIILGALVLNLFSKMSH